MYHMVILGLSVSPDLIRALQSQSFDDLAYTRDIHINIPLFGPDPHCFHSAYNSNSYRIKIGED